MRTIIVDDERLAREEFKSMLKKYPQIEVVGEFKNTIEAEQGLKELEPDVMFIDIQMPGETGLEFLERIDFAPRTIFVTAYDEFAIKAFELNAYDYLLKPLDPERLEEVITRIEEETVKEFIGEGHIFFDLIRWKKQIGYSSGIPDFIDWDDPRNIYPIPQREIDVNANLKQNEGY